MILAENVKKECNSQRVTDVAWKLAASKEYHNCLDEIGQISMGAKSYLNEIEWSTFVDAFFRGKRFGKNTIQKFERYYRLL